MVLCSDLYISFVGSSLVTMKPLSSKYKRHNFFKKPYTPVIPAVFQGFACSSGPKNISYILKVSAPYCLQISSGFTTLYLDLDIFSTSRETTKASPWPPPKEGESELKTSPLSNMKTASLNSGRQFLKPSISSSSEKF